MSKPIQASLPDTRGYFGAFGGRFVPETLMAALDELEQAFEQTCHTSEFQGEMEELLHDFVGRPTPLLEAHQLSAHCRGARIVFKREDLAHTGAHKINNALGQVLLAQRMGKTRIIAETGAGQHGVATATAAARVGLECVVYMGAEDVERQRPNVQRMELLGAEVHAVRSGAQTLKDAINDAIRDWVTHIADTHYVIGSVVGPHPYPYIVREFQRVIGVEARRQCRDQFGRLPDVIAACVGGGSNAIGIFHPFLDDPVELVGVEAAGDGLDTRRHAASLTEGTVGVLHGARSYLLQDAHGQVEATHSVSAGLDYPGVGPEHSYLKEAGRVRYVGCDDRAALAALRMLCQTEGIIPALETAHAIAWAMEEAARRPADDLILVNLSGRGDKDLFIIEEHSR